MYNGNVIETVNSYCYLGIMLKCNGSFNLAMSTLAEKARKTSLYNNVVLAITMTYSGQG
jgi:hypothetical protein